MLEAVASAHSTTDNSLWSVTSMLSLLVETHAGFVKGVGQGLVGAVAAPVSGGLDLFSSAIEGLDASKERLLGRPRAGTLLARRRLPRVIGGEAKLQPFIRDGSETAVSRGVGRHTVSCMSVEGL